MTESAKCSFVQYPNHPQLFRRAKCNTILMKTVKHGSKSKLIPRAVYAYKSLEVSLTKLYNQPTFVEQCNLWRSRANQSSGYFTDVYMMERFGMTSKLFKVDHFFCSQIICEP